MALLVHERAVFALAGLPLLRVLLDETPLDRTHVRRWLPPHLALAAAALAYLAARHFVLAPSSLDFAFYAKEVANGSVYARLDLTWSFFWSCVWAAYKYLLAGAALAIGLLAFGRTRKAAVDLGFAAGFSALVCAQLFAAVDTVRLLDFLIFPLVFVAARALRASPRASRVVLWTLAAAVVLNQLTPIEYQSQNLSFVVESETRRSVFGLFR